MQSRAVRRIALIAGLLGMSLALGTVGFRTIEGYPWFDAFYMTLSTITTVGFQETRPLSQGGRIFDAFLILFGTSAMFLALGAMTQTIIQLELQEGYGKRRKRRMIQALHDHVIVCGFGRVGRNASFELQRVGAPFLVLDREEQRLAKATGAGMNALMGDATQDECLREAGVLRARGLIAALPSDAENLFIILSAKTLNPALTVVTRASEEEAGAKLRRAGADTVLTPYALAGRQLADVLLRPHVAEFLDLARSNMLPNITIEQICVQGSPRSRGRSPARLSELTQTGVMVLAIRREGSETIFNPPSDTEVNPGDALIVMGERPQLRAFEQAVES